MIGFTTSQGLSKIDFEVNLQWSGGCLGVRTRRCSGVVLVKSEGYLATCNVELDAVVNSRLRLGGILIGRPFSAREIEDTVNSAMEFRITDDLRLVNFLSVL